MPGGSSRECRDRHLGRTRHHMDRRGRFGSHHRHESRFRPPPAALSPARGVPPYRRNRPRSPDIRDVQVRLRSCRCRIQSRGPFSRATIRRRGHGPIPHSGPRNPTAYPRSRMIFRILHRPSQTLRGRARIGGWVLSVRRSTSPRRSRRVYRSGPGWPPDMAKSDPRADLAAKTKASRGYANRARRSLPAGVTAGVKYFDPYPIAMKKAKGCRLWDLDGNEYIDYCLSFGPLVLGHSHPRVMKAIRDSLQSAGTTMFGTPHELEATYAERLLRIFRPDGRMRFTMSGTEATVHAVRLARAYRKRPMIAKFEGHYHGGLDELLVSHAPSREEVVRGAVPRSGSRGTPDHVLKNTLVLPFNDLDETAARIRGQADRLACVILEPVERSYIPPEPDFLNGLREITADHDIPLIFDEVMSGFRVAFGGAQHAYRVKPDLTCLGKIIGGGLPCGAFLGRSDILDLADPARGEFFHSSTFAGYPIAMAAGMATLIELEKPGAFDGLLKTTRTLTSGFERLLKDHSVPAVVPAVGSVFSILFTNRASRNYRDSLAADEAQRSVLDTSLLARGIFVKPGKPFYVSTAHDNIAIRETLDAFEESLSGPA